MNVHRDRSSSAAVRCLRDEWNIFITRQSETITSGWWGRIVPMVLVYSVFARGRGGPCEFRPIGGPRIDAGLGSVCQTDDQPARLHDHENTPWPVFVMV